MRKTLTLSQQTESSLVELREIYKERLGATRVTDGWIVNLAVKTLYDKEMKDIQSKGL